LKRCPNCRNELKGQVSNYSLKEQVDSIVGKVVAKNLVYKETITIGMIPEGITVEFFKFNYFT